MHRLLVLAMLFSLVAVPDLAAAQSTGSGMSLEAFIQKQLKVGKDDTFGKHIGAFLGYPDEVKEKVIINDLALNYTGSEPTG